MARVCVRHPFELSANFCGHCGLEFCRGCLVFPKGPKKHALCVTCAIAASGVRSTAAKHPPISKRELKRRMKEREEEDRVLARHEREPAPIDPIMKPFKLGWPAGTEERPAPPEEREPVTVAAAQQQLPPPPAVLAADAFVRTESPTLADLLPSVPPTPSSVAPPPSPTSLTSLTITPQEPGHAIAPLADLPDDEPEEDRRPRTLPLLRRREPEPVDDGAGASEMIAWLDEVFAPKDQS